MEDFFERLERMKINVISPDGTVRAHYAVTEGINIELRLDTYSGHTEESLALQIIAAVKGVCHGYAKATNPTAEGERRQSPQQSKPRELPFDERRQRFSEEVGKIAESASSLRGFVQASWSGRGDFNVNIRPGTLNRLDVNQTQLATEVNHAITTAHEAFEKCVDRAYKNAYQSS
ncbi:MAG: hypothetical protein ACRDXX_16285 [Stackebrandtia sp.]